MRMWLSKRECESYFPKICINLFYCYTALIERQPRCKNWMKLVGKDWTGSSPDKVQAVSLYLRDVYFVTSIRSPLTRLGSKQFNSIDEIRQYTI